MGNGIPVSVTPDKEVTLNFEADMRMLTKGLYYLGLRAQSGAGFWSNLLSFADFEFVGVKGDVNGDCVVNMVDVTMIINYILGRNPAGFIENNVNLNNNKKIDYDDIDSIIDIILNR